MRHCKNMWVCNTLWIFYSSTVHAFCFIISFWCEVKQCHVLVGAVRRCIYTVTALSPCLIVFTPDICMGQSCRSMQSNCNIDILIMFAIRYSTTVHAMFSSLNMPALSVDNHVWMHLLYMYSMWLVGGQNVWLYLDIHVLHSKLLSNYSSWALYYFKLCFTA